MNPENKQNDKMRILIVDDNKDNIELIYQILENECFIETANNGK